MSCIVKISVCKPEKILFSCIDWMKIDVTYATRSACHCTQFQMQIDVCFCTISIYSSCSIYVVVDSYRSYGEFLCLKWWNRSTGKISKSDVSDVHVQPVGLIASLNGNSELFTEGTVDGG